MCEGVLTVPKQIPIPNILDAILSGFSEARQNYEEWSGGFWLWQAPEYLISSTVAGSISKLNGPKYITLEHGSTSTLEDAGARGRGRLPKDIREKGKVDILLWWGTDTPRGIIEIKNQIYSLQQYENDIKRIGKFLNRNIHESSLQFGVLAFYESAMTGKRKKATYKVRDKVKSVYLRTKELLS